ncbi:hypothetical protein LTS15_002434 [Exophiala xenobiotica]|nr:hypothetical protein LTS15_002434 [Exophiala xenobiotica]
MKVVFKGKLHVAMSTGPCQNFKTRKMISSRLGILPYVGGTDFIMGHEFTAETVELGPDVQKFVKGDNNFTPFTINWGQCFYCKKEFSSRCKKS